MGWLLRKEHSLSQKRLELCLKICRLLGIPAYSSGQLPKKNTRLSIYLQPEVLSRVRVDENRMDVIKVGSGDFWLGHNGTEITLHILGYDNRSGGLPLLGGCDHSMRRGLPADYFLAERLLHFRFVST